MKTKTPTKKKTAITKKVAGFEPTKVALLVSFIAALTLVTFAILGHSMSL